MKTRYLGARLTVDLDDAAGYGIALNTFERRELDDMLDACARIRPSLFLDVGAGIGLYACVVGGRSACRNIVAFEPDPARSEKLAANLALNRLEGRTEIHPLTPGAEAGSRLDDYVRRDGDALAARIDANGHEIEAIMGGAQLFARNRGCVQMIGRNRRAAGVVAELMAAFGWSRVRRDDAILTFEKP